MLRAYRKIGWRAILILSVLAILFSAFIVRSELGANTFATGSGTGKLEMKIDSKTWYNGVYQPQLSWKLKHLNPWSDHFFDFDDVKPGDTGTSSLSIHIKENPAWVCLDFRNLADKENGINEPESHNDGNTQGELSKELEFFGWRDDGDYKYEVGEKSLFGASTTQSASQVLYEKTYALADYANGPAYKSNSTHYVGITWCAGNLEVNTATAKITCDGEVMGNESQTDSMTLDISFRTVSALQQPKFACVKEPEVPKCEVEGHKYDQDGDPLEGWTIGLMRVVSHNKGTDIYDLATDVTDKDGYFCLDWDFVKKTPRGTVKYKSGPTTVTYRVFEKQKSDWKNVAIEKGVNWQSLAEVASSQIQNQDGYVSVQIGAQNATPTPNGEYHVDFYNKKFNKYTQHVKDTCKRVAHNAWNKFKKWNS